MLAGFCFVVLLHIYGLRLAVDAFDVCLGLDIGFLHLQRHEASGQGHHADVMSGGGFYGYDVAFLQGYLVAVAEISLAGILELNLYQLALIGIARNVCQPVVGVQLLVLPAATLAAETSASVM